MAMSSGRGPGGAMSEINVTPFVDVMLVLLIIFMVTAPLIQQGVDVELPAAQAQPMESDEEKLVLTIDRDRRIFLGKTEVPFAELRDKLATNARLQKEKELYLHADRRLTYGFVVEVMAILKEAGVDDLGMVTDPVGDPAGNLGEEAPSKR